MLRIKEETAKAQELDTGHIVFRPDILQDARAVIALAVSEADGIYEIAEKGPAAVERLDEYRLAEVIPLFPDK